MVNEIVSVLAIFGITAETAPRYVLFAVVGCLGLYFSFSKPIQKSLEKVGGRCSKMEEYLSVLSSVLISRGNVETLEVFTSKSPLFLNEIGLRILKDSPFIKIFDENKSKIFATIDEVKPTNKYDVEQRSLWAIISNMDEAWMAPMKIYFYNHPIIRIDTGQIDQPKFMKAASLYVRDEYLKFHPEIKE